MCGIAGWFGTVEVDERTATSVVAALRHRGPDGNGVERTALGGLIHTRLKVLDPSEAGAQPMHSPDGSVCVVFNGEIYNHHELRRMLEAKGHRFRGHADSEVLPALYLEHGPSFVELLRGMFALAVLDQRHQSLLLARDRFGIKPLFWAETKGTEPSILFASELDALRRFPDVDLRTNAQAVHDFVALHFVPAPLTIHRGVHNLQPGHMVNATREHGRVRHRRAQFHRWRIAPDPSISEEVAANEVARLLDAAVASQLESDVPLGGLLSGGIDSSLVCESAQRVLGGTLRTFGVRFDDPEFDEGRAIAMVADHLGTDHTMLGFSTADSSWEAVARVLRAAGQPFADTSILAVQALSRLVREQVTVALSGDGGDEPFAGYDHYARLWPLSRMAALPAPMRSLAFRTLARVSDPFSRRGRLSSHLPIRLRDAATAEGEIGLLADQLTWVRSNEMSGLWAGADVEPVRRWFEPEWDHDLPRGTSRVGRMFALATEADTRLRLAGDYLPKVDTASMQESLEVRVPLLDEDLFGYALTLPHDLKRRRDGDGKRPLRAIATQRVPVVASLPKHGFGVPVDTWVDHQFKHQLREQLLDGSTPVHEFLEPTATRHIVDAFTSGRLLPEMTRQALYQRAIMLMALDLGLRQPRLVP